MPTILKDCINYAKSCEELQKHGLVQQVPESGGMDLEGDEHLISGKRTSCGDEDPNYFGVSKGKIPFGEQSSRTLFVRNINSNVEDSELKALFEVNLYSFILADAVLEFS